MNEGSYRPRAASEYRRDRPGGLAARPDRVALWAVMLAVVAMVAGAASARAGSGGSGTGDGGHKSCSSADFGKRKLERGDCGRDVKTLNWILKAKDFGVPLERAFRDRTEGAVRKFQSRHGLNSSGVVADGTRRELVHTLHRHTASWYGPGFWGNRTACGQTLHRKTVGVAHRNLPCGTKVVIGYKGNWLRTKVIDRGPYVKRNYSRDWDLTQRAARKIGFEYTDKVRAAKLR